MEAVRQALTARLDDAQEAGDRTEVELVVERLVGQVVGVAAADEQGENASRAREVEVLESRVRALSEALNLAKGRLASVEEQAEQTGKELKRCVVQLPCCY